MEKRSHHKVRNWPAYNNALRAQGAINIWFSEEASQRWFSNEGTGKKGRPPRYSDEAILTALMLRALFKLPLRALEGFLGSVIELMKLQLTAPCYTQICRRSQQLGKPLNQLSSQSVTDLVFDSTGLKVYGEGEWKVRKHGASKRRVWRKLHLAVCPKSHAIIMGSLTTHSVTDAEVCVKMLESSSQSLARIYGDGAYDKLACYKACYERGLVPIIPPQRNAAKSNGKLPSLAARDSNQAQIASLGGLEGGRKRWKRLVGYHQQSLAETAIYRFKQLLGGRLSSRKLSSQQAEVAAKCMVLNKMMALRMPLREIVAA